MTLTGAQLSLCCQLSNKGIECPPENLRNIFYIALFYSKNSFITFFYHYNDSILQVSPLYPNVLHLMGPQGRMLLMQTSNFGIQPQFLKEVQAQWELWDYGHSVCHLIVPFQTHNEILSFVTEISSRICLHLFMSSGLHH